MIMGLLVVLILFFPESIAPRGRFLGG